jgi:hypothetical protein
VQWFASIYLGVAKVALVKLEIQKHEFSPYEYEWVIFEPSILMEVSSATLDCGYFHP